MFFSCGSHLRAISSMSARKLQTRDTEYVALFKARQSLTLNSWRCTRAKGSFSSRPLENVELFYIRWLCMVQTELRRVWGTFYSFLRSSRTNRWALYYLCSPCICFIFFCFNNFFRFSCNPLFAASVSFTPSTSFRSFQILTTTSSVMFLDDKNRTGVFLQSFK